MKKQAQVAESFDAKVVPFAPRSGAATPGETLSAFAPYANGREYGISSEEAFREMLSLERKRTERSGKPFLLMLLDVRSFAQLNGKAEAAYKKALAGVAAATRETDIKGWYQAGAFLGVVFTEVGGVDRKALMATVRGKVEAALAVRLQPSLLGGVGISFHWFPEEIDTQGPRLRKDFTLYPDESKKSTREKISLAIKRAMDICGSALALLLLAPVCALIALGIRLTSKGPILFRQQRIGQHGVPFTFLKFRTMYVVNDHTLHKEFVARLIKGKVKAEEGSDSGIYKIQQDPRITPFGRLLRRTSLDELPQFWNVLRGDMSLVGPRPPIPYELENYDVWHRRRVLEVKPGITGLWQVTGRSRTTFDDMVRLDLQYASSWTPWLDLKILLRTPKAVLSGNGAY
jgi:lipopolysaccharide/colanic/teichoic acid biosynthesis glycosyltransferase